MMNIEKIEKLIHMLRSHPDGYEQTTWGSRWLNDSDHSCGTAACLAGYAVLMEGYELWFGPDKYETEECVNAQGELFYIFDVAQKILGLDKKTARILFSPDGGKWRHSLLKAAIHNELDIAVRELWDLARLGPYAPKKKKARGKKNHGIPIERRSLVSDHVAAKVV